MASWRLDCSYRSFDFCNSRVVELLAATGGSDGSAYRLTELGDDRLLDFAHRIKRTHRNERPDAQDRQDSYQPGPIHRRFLLVGVEVQKWQNAARLLVDNDLGAYARHDVLQGLDIDAAAGNLWGLDVFRQ